MDDLISRKAAIERIEKQKYREPSIGVWKQNDRVALVCYDTVIEALKRLPSAEPRWIPVSEKYPTPWELVWVTDKRGHVNVCQMSHKDNQYWYDGEEEWMYEHDAVVAWMPYYVPEPYQEADHE